jgi:membrane-bound metal-dependent hydrolase YbcI (DUF457 family)
VKVERGAGVVLLVDFLATMGVITFGLLYARVDPVYLALLAGITFALFFVISFLLRRSSVSVRPSPEEAQ